MPLVIWLSQLFATVVAFLSTYITKKFATVVAAVSSLGLIIATFTAVLDAAIDGLTSIAPTGAVLFGLGLLPDNVPACIAALLSVQIGAVVYRYYTNIIDFTLKG